MDTDIDRVSGLLRQWFGSDVTGPTIGGEFITDLEDAGEMRTVLRDNLDLDPGKKGQKR